MFEAPSSRSSRRWPIGLDHLDRGWSHAWTVALVLLGVNTAVSNTRSLYTWQWVAQRTAPIQAVAHGFERDRYDRVVLVVDDVPFWRFALTADDLSPMVAELFGNPRLEVQIIQRANLATVGGDPTRTLYLDPENAFRPLRPDGAPRQP